MFNVGGAIEGLKFEVKGGAELSELDDRYRGKSNGVTVTLKCGWFCVWFEFWVGWF